MKKVLLFTTLGFTAIAANAQDFIAGFDFTNRTGAQDVAVYGADTLSGPFAQAGVSMDTSAFIQGSDFGGAALSVEGRQVGFDTVGNTPVLADFDGQNGFSSDQYGLFFQGTIDGLSFTIDVDTSGFNSIFFGYDSFSDDTAVQTGGEWFTSLDGGSNSSLGLVNFTGAYAADSYNIDVTGVDSLSLIFTFASLEMDTFGNPAVTSDRVHFDNFAIGGTPVPVPEPSAYAAIAGIIALAFAVNRRRKA
jgi:hypothetical protein